MMARGLCVGVVVLASACATEDHQLQIQACQSGQTRDPFNLGQSSVQAGELTIPVEVGGGCATHSFAICWDGAVIDTAPGQIDLALMHDAHGDTCDGGLHFMLHVDLAPVRDKFLPPLIVNVLGAASQLAGTTNRALIEN
jgi:hypothetical protein